MLLCLPGPLEPRSHKHIALRPCHTANMASLAHGKGDAPFVKLTTLFLTIRAPSFGMHRG